MCITVQESTMMHVHCQSNVYYTVKVMCITVQESTMIHVHCQSNVYYCTRINYDTCTLSK